MRHRTKTSMILAVILVLMFAVQANARIENESLSESPIVLTIRTDKPTYVMGEEIAVQFKFTNVSKKPINFFVFAAGNRALYRWLEVFEIGGKRTAVLDPMGSIEDRSGFQHRQETILPGKHLISQVTFDTKKLAEIRFQNGNSSATATHQFVIRGGYLFPVGVLIPLESGQEGFFSRSPIYSDPITIELK